MTNETKQTIKTFTIVLIVSFALGFLTNYCRHKDNPNPTPTTPDHSSLTKSDRKDDSVIVQAKRNDSLLKVYNVKLRAMKLNYTNKYNRVYDSLLNVQYTDTNCNKSLVLLYNEFGVLSIANDKLIANNDSIISNKDTIISRLEHKVISKQSRVSMDSLWIGRLCDSIPKVKRKALWKGCVQGAAFYAIIREGISTFSKLKL